MKGEKLCKELDVLIRDYIKKENLQITIEDETPELPWKHYNHQDFRISTEPSKEEEIAISVLRGEDPMDGFGSPPLFAVSEPENGLKFFDYFVKNHTQFLYKDDGFNYFNEEKLLDGIKNELKLDITEIPQRLSFDYFIPTN